MIDLTAEPVTRESCYETYVDPTLPHQLKIMWDQGTKSPQLRTRAECNCGYVIGVFRPEEEGSLALISLGYAMHVDSLL